MELSRRRRLVAAFALAGACLSAPFPLRAAGDFELGIHFLKDGDYYRAITQMERFRFMNPGSARSGEALEIVAASYFLGHRWKSAARRYGQLLAAQPSHAQSLRRSFFYGESLYEDGDFAPARKVFQALWDSPVEREMRRLAGLRLASLKVAGLGWQDAAERFEAVARAEEDETWRLRAADWGARSRKMAARKPPRPWVAALASTVVPGAGQAASGYWGDGLSALSLVGGFALWSLVSQRNNQQELAWGFGVAAGIFHLGNIHGAVNAARRSADEIPAMEGRRILEEIGAVDSPQPDLSRWLK